MTEMEEFDACTTYRRRGEKCTISCKMGLWSVEGKYGLSLINEAMHYWRQYKSDGEYSSIIGGETAEEVFLALIEPQDR